MKTPKSSASSLASNSLSLKATGKQAAVFIALAAVLTAAFLLVSHSAFASELKESEPITTHEPQTYVFDYREDIGNRLTKGNGEHIYGTGNPRSEWDLLPILLPGDKVKIIPDLPTVEYALEHSRTSVGVAGLVFYDRTAETKEPSFKVTEAVSYGEPGSNGNGSTFIQEFEITGTEPVMVVITGGTNGYTLERKTVRVNETDVEVTLAYAAEWLTIKRFPEYINLNYQFFDAANNQFFDDANPMDDPGVVYYGETENPDAIWAVDAIYNIKAEEKATFKINRPYAEGYEIVFDDIYRDSRAYNWPLYTEFDETDTMTVTPRWGDNSRTISQGYTVEMVGSYEDDWTNVKYDCYPGRTLTLDACGGTINGSASRIYEMGAYSDRYLSLDEDEASGLYTPVRDGYIFDGWYTDKDYSVKAESIKSVLKTYSDNSENRSDRICRLYAKWVSNVTGWVEEDGNKYYYDEPGVLHTGWLTLEKDKYYFDENGVMLTGWQLVDGNWYYLDSEGVMQTGWLKIGNWYYLDDNGVMQTGWIKVDGVWYYLRESGAMHTGWLQSGSTWYYLLPSGAMATGWQQIGVTWYYFSGSGAMFTGWFQSGNTWYYLQSSGAMKTGWLLSGGNWYYLLSSGAMKTGWLQSGGKWYYFEASGEMVTGWKTIGNYKYYFDGSGAMVTGTVRIDGKRYTFDEDGHCLNA